MADPDPVDESLAIARRALAPSAANKQRVRSTLAASRPTPTLNVGRASGRLKAWLSASALVGAGFVAGYWLGRHPEVDPLASAVGGAPDTPSRAPTATLAAGVAPAPAATASDPEAPPLETVSGSPPTADASTTGVAASGTPSSEPGSDSPHGRARVPTEDGPSASELVSRAKRVRRATSSDGSVRALDRPPSGDANAVRAADGSPPTDASDAFLEELALLARVERAIRANQAELALTLLDELSQRYPSSVLIEERSAARLLTDCLLKEPTARARAERFVREHPTSVYLERVRNSCRLDATTLAPK